MLFFLVSLTGKPYNRFICCFSAHRECKNFIHQTISKFRSPSPRTLDILSIFLRQTGGLVKNENINFVSYEILTQCYFFAEYESSWIHPSNVWILVSLNVIANPVNNTLHLFFVLFHSQAWWKDL